MENTCIMQGCVVGKAKQNVTLHEFSKERERRQLWRRFVQTTRSHWKPTGHSHVCSSHTSFLLTLLTMSNTMGFEKKRVISKTAVPTSFPSKLALSQRSLRRWTRRLGLAGPGSVIFFPTLVPGRTRSGQRPFSTN